MTHEVPGYRIERVLGRGSTGVVYLAKDLQLRRDVALKIVDLGLVDGELIGKFFDRESRSAAKLEHPNIIPIYAAGQAGGVLYIVMRYVRGGDLQSLLDRDGPLSFMRTISVIDAVADALTAAHAEGMVHRDVKPANILCGSRNGKDHYYLTDFGTIKVGSSGRRLTATGQIVGTIDYIAPEQIQGESVDRRADIYSLGCVLYHCLAGVVPFPREKTAALIWAHLNEDPPPVTACRADLPSQIDRIVAKAMAKKPGDRYASCLELTLALHEIATAPAASNDDGDNFSKIINNSLPRLAAAPRVTETYVALPGNAKPVSASEGVQPGTLFSRLNRRLLTVASVAAITIVAVATLGIIRIWATHPSHPTQSREDPVTALQEEAKRDRGSLEAIAPNWVPQLSLKKEGMVAADGITYDDAQILADYKRWRANYPQVKLLWSTEWLTYRSSPGSWVTVIAVPFSTPDDVSQWCAQHSLPRNECSPILLNIAR